MPPRWDSGLPQNKNSIKLIHRATAVAILGLTRDASIDGFLFWSSDTKQLYRYDRASDTYEQIGAGVDLAQSSPSLRTLGTGNLQAAAGDHTHSGTYASTAHAATHAGGGSDPVTSLGAHSITGLVSITPTDGSGRFDWAASTVNLPQPTADTVASVGVRRVGLRPMLAMREYFSGEYIIGSILLGPIPWCWLPNTSTTIVSAVGSPVTGTGTISHPAISGTIGRRTKFATAASTSASAGVMSTDALWTPGASATDIASGFMYHAIVTPEDASYNAAGATTGSRLFCGMTDAATVAAMLASDNVAALNYAGFQRYNVNGGKTQTNWQFCMKDGTTESLQDTGVALTQSHTYELYVWCQRGRGNGYLSWRIKDLTAGGDGVTNITNTNAPSTTSILRAMCGVFTVNATARSLSAHRMSVEQV